MDLSDIAGLEPASERQLAARLFNSTWDLIDTAERTEDDDIEMFLMAAASRWHWARVGGEAELATGEWQVAHVASLLGLGECALLFAHRALKRAKKEGWRGWQLATYEEGMARACAAVGDSGGRTRHIKEAEAALAEEPDEESRQLIEDQLATIPETD